MANQEVFLDMGQKNCKQTKEAVTEGVLKLSARQRS